MAILTAADFRPDTTAEACIAHTLTAQEAEANDLTATIARYTRRIYDICNDEFESTTQTIELNVFVGSLELLLPKRFTSLSAVKTRYYDNSLTTQDPTHYRLRSSLDVNGAIRQGLYDWIYLIPYAGGLLNVIGGPYCWPYGTNTVQVTGAVGWLVTPFDIKKALALLVWDHYKAQRGDLDRARSLSSAGQTVTFVPDTPGATGLPEVDAILEDYSYGSVIG